jgi:pilus assembly protein CpaE
VPVTPTPSGFRKLALVVHGTGAPDDLLNEVLSVRGFGPVVMVASLVELTAQLRTRMPSLVIVPVPPGGAGSEFASFQQELRRHPGTAAIGTSPSKDADTVLAAMRAGIPEFLVSPIDRLELEVALSRLLSHGTASQQQGQLFTVYTAKGGLGASTLALSLAWALAHLPSRPSVALVDFSTTGAGVRVMLDLKPLYDLGSVASRADRLDREFLRSVMIKHEQGVHVLAAADELDAGDPMSVEAAGRLLELLRQEHTYVVVDTDHHFGDQTIAALDAADRILLLTQLDVSALRSTQRTLGVFARLGYPETKVNVVVNRQSERDAIPAADAERVIGRRIDFKLPNDYASCADAITYGRFVQEQAPASAPVVTAVARMAATLTGNLDAATGDRGARSQGSRLSRLFGRG